MNTFQHVKFQVGLYLAISKITWTLCGLVLKSAKIPITITKDALKIVYPAVQELQGGKLEIDGSLGRVRRHTEKIKNKN